MDKIAVLCALILTPVFADVETGSEVELRQAILPMLSERLQKGDLNSSKELLDQISKLTQRSVEDTRAGLLCLLDTLDAHRLRQSEAWQGVIAGVEKEVGPKVVERFPKFLSELSDRCRKMLMNQADYGPQWEVDEAAKKARITPQDGKRILQNVLAASGGTTQVQAPPAQIPSRVGVVVAAGSSFEQWNPVAPWRQYFATGDDMEPAIQAVRGIAQSTLPILIQKLPESRFVKWAVEKPTSQLKPDCKLLLEIRTFGIWPASDRGDDYRPVIKAAIILEPVEGGSTIFEQSFTIKSQALHGYQEKKPPDVQILYAEIAQGAYNALDSFLAKNSGSQSSQ